MNRRSNRRRALPSFRIGYEEYRLGVPFRNRWRGALAYEQGRLVAAEMRARRLSVRPWCRRDAPPRYVMAMAAALAGVRA